MRVWRAVVVGVGVLLVACGGTSQDTSATGRPDEDTTALTTATTEGVRTTPGPPQTPATGPLTTPSTSRHVDDYLPTGVPDQVFPPGTSAYQLLKDGECGPLLRQITRGEAPTTVSWSAGGVPATLTDLYTAAANACLAQWGPAQTSFQRIDTAKLCESDPDNPGALPPSASSFASLAACRELRLRVYRWTENLLNAHSGDPSFVPNFPTPPKR